MVENGKALFKHQSINGSYALVRVLFKPLDLTVEILCLFSACVCGSIKNEQGSNALH